MAGPTDYLAYYPLKTDATDETGNYDGVNNGVTFFREEPTFDGVGAYVDLTVPAAGSTDITFTGWIKLRVDQETTVIAQEGSPGVNTRGVKLYVEGPTKSNSNILEFYSQQEGDESQTYYTRAYYLPSDTYMFFAAVQDGDTISIYIDGIFVSSKVMEDEPPTTLGVKSYTETINLGKPIGLNSNYFDGNLSDVRVYDYSLTQQQITNINNEERPRYYFDVVDLDITSDDKMFDDLIDLDITSEDSVPVYVDINITSEDSVPVYVDLNITSSDHQGEIIDFDIISTDIQDPALLQFYIVSEDIPESYSPTIIKRVNE